MEQELHGNMRRLNPVSWFRGLNLRLWVIVGFCTLIACVFPTVCEVIYSLRASLNQPHQVMMSFLRPRVISFNQNEKGGYVGAHDWVKKL